MANIATPYVLPFEVQHTRGALFSKHGDVHVGLELTSRSSPAAADAFHGMVIAFSELASTGALAGAQIPPSESKVADHSDPNTTSTLWTLSWTLNRCYLDEASLLVLVHLFFDLHVEYPIRRLLISSGNEAGLQRLAEDPKLVSPYPGIFAQVPFAWHISQDVMDTPSLWVRFKDTPSDSQRNEIRQSLLTWAAATSLGAYAVAPVPPRDCGLAVDPDVTIVDDELDWEITSFYAHPDALRGLVNALVAISTDIAAIAELSID